MAIEYSGDSGDIEVMVSGLTRSTNLPELSIRSLIGAGRLNVLFGADGKIKPFFRNPYDPQAALRHMQQRADQFGFRRCPVCNDVYVDYRCHCTKPRISREGIDRRYRLRRKGDA